MSDELTRAPTAAEPTPPPADEAARAVHRIHAALHDATGVDWPVRLWDGSELGATDAGFRLVLHHPWSLRALLLPPSDLSAGEAYVHGDVDVEGDLIAGLATGRRLASAMSWSARLDILKALLRLPRPPKRKPLRRARLQGRRHSKERDRQAIAFHYDLPQRFYECFLDERLVYSCAYFGSPDDTLGEAQEAKLDLICRKLRLAPGQRLLDVGCGWGSLLHHAAAHYGVHGVGVTLSRVQAETGRERLAAAGLHDRIEIRLADYRDLTGTFDAVVSVGMFEHVGPEHLEEYFAHLHRLTEPGGLMLNHGIVRGDPQAVRASKTRDFIGTYVFPDGGFVPAWQAVRHVEAAGFELLDVEQLRRHYALTLRRWIANLERSRADAVAVASEADYRIWRAYMAGSALGFEVGHLGVVQVLGQRDGPAGERPLRREWWLRPDGRVG